jgi:hypothetical protein
MRTIINLYQALFFILFAESVILFGIATFLGLGMAWAVICDWNRSKKKDSRRQK